MSPADRLLGVLTAAAGVQSSTASDLSSIFRVTGFGNIEVGNLIMIAVGLAMIGLAVRKNYEPLLLVPIGFGIIAGNIPYDPALMPIGYQDVLNGQQSVFNLLYFGVSSGLFPPLIVVTGVGKSGLRTNSHMRGRLIDQRRARSAWLARPPASAAPVQPAWTWRM